MKPRNLLSALFAALSVATFAQLEHGKVYRFINKADSKIVLTASSLTDVYGRQTIDNDYSQLWYVEKHPNNSNAWSLRSLGNGLYLRPTSTSVMWTFNNTPASSTVLYCLSTGNNYYTLNPYNSTANSLCMHYATSQGGAVVGWNTGAEATHWKIEECKVDADDLQENWDALDSFNSIHSSESVAKYQAALNNLFADAACTKLKKSFSSVEQLKADTDYKALPAELQNMAVKVYTDEWSEPNFDSNKKAWGSEYGKRFRIQSIEPYSIAGQITDWLGINAHSNMDNPTGISGNYRQHLYVMVDGSIKTGAELWLCSIAGHSLVPNYNSGVKLHEGLNVIPFSGDGNAVYINYVVHTYNTGSRKMQYKLSDFPDLKVHIEGGNINGFFNGVGDHLWGEPDDDIDWQYYEERANLDNVTLLGKRQILHFCLNDTEYQEDGRTKIEKGMAYYLPDVKVPAGTPANKKVNTMLEAWDRIHLSELATMGLLSKAEMDSLNNLYPSYNEKWEKAGPIYEYNERMYNNQKNIDYSEYFNHHGVAYGNFSGYMSGGWKNCNYHHNTMGSIIGAIAVEAGSTWGPAHEIGHQHQSVFTVNGLTEVTNNMHSNIAVWYMGLGTSRVNGTEGNLERVYDNFLEDTHYLFHHHNNGSQNLWTQTQMYYKLWMYYHLTGHNTTFFPYLFELNRRDRMSSSALGSIDGIGHTSGTESMLKYYKQACQAAEEDLTEFFRAHGFFVTMNKELRGDYSNSYYTQTQDEIDAAIAWVKAKGYKENLAPLFINDCVAETTYSHDGKTKRSYWDPETASGKNAKVGMYTDCINSSVKAQGYYYDIENGKDSNGKGVSIININRKAGAKGAIGFIVYKDEQLVAFTNNLSVNVPRTADSSKLKIYAVQADGSKVELLSAAEAGTKEEQRAALAASITKVTNILDIVVKDGSETGYYFSENINSIKSLYNEARTAYINKDQSVHSYGKWSMLLEAEYTNLTTNSDSYLCIKEKAYYSITSGYAKKYRLTSSNGELAISESSDNTEDNMWTFISTGITDEYYLMNKKGYYLSSIKNNMNGILSTTSKVRFTVAHHFLGNFKLIAHNPNSDGTTEDSAIYLDNANGAAHGKDNGSIDESDTKGFWRLITVEGQQEALEYERGKLRALIGKANGVLELTIDEEQSSENQVILKEGVYADSTIVSNSELSDLLLTLYNTRNDAKEQLADESIIDHTKTIKALKSALAAVDGKYLVAPRYPIASTDSEYTWYFIKSKGKNEYCGAVNGKVTLEALNDIENNRAYWWAFESTGKNNEYYILNAETGTYLYNSIINNTLQLSASQKGYTLAVDEANYAFKVYNGSSYWNNEKAGAVNIGNSNKASLWVLEKIITENPTGIDDIYTDCDNTAEGIYDLTGRKLQDITAPGIYIINGKKMLVK